MLVPELPKESEGEEKEPGSFSLSSLLPSFFSSPVESVQVAGSLPITVRDPAQQNLRRPVVDPPSSSNQGGGILSSLFSRPSSRRPSPRPRPRPIRPDVPAQKVVFQFHLPLSCYCDISNPGAWKPCRPVCASCCKQATRQAGLHPSANAGGGGGSSKRPVCSETWSFLQRGHQSDAQVPQLQPNSNCDNLSPFIGSLTQHPGR